MEKYHAGNTGPLIDWLPKRDGDIPGSGNDHVVGFRRDVAGSTRVTGSGGLVVGNPTIIPFDCLCIP